MMLTLAQFDRIKAKREPVAQAFIFAALVALPAVVSLARGMVDEPDVWWHIKAGQWIFEHRTWPEVDIFSATGAGHPWLAYSWLPELMLAGLYDLFGLRGLVIYTAALSSAIIAALLALLRRTGVSLTTLVGLTLAGVVGLIPLENPRPWLFSILFCVIEIDLLLSAGQGGDRRRLLWLVPLFALWANVHIQFILGLAVLGAAVTESLLSRVLHGDWIDDDSRRVPPGWMAAIFAMSAAATLINPYHYHLYVVAWSLISQSSQLGNIIQELHAMPFRSVADWTVIGVAVSAAFALGWKRRVRLLLLILLIAGVWISFRCRRDAWFVLVVGLAVIASVASKGSASELATGRWLRWAIGATTAAVVLVGGMLVNNSKLESKVTAGFPTGAVRFVRDHQYGGPMFNPFSWGGYLIYHLPNVPVSIDGRTMVYSDAALVRHAQTLRAAPGWRNDPQLADARLVLVPSGAALTALLESDDRYRRVYEDAVATVFARNENERPQPATGQLSASN